MANHPSQCEAYYADKCSSFLTDEVSVKKFSSYLDALKHVYKFQRTELNRIYVQAPKVNFNNKRPSDRYFKDAERRVD